MKTTHEFDINQDDIVLPFQLENSLLRGRVVRLGTALHAILKQHAYPKPVGRLLGEAVALALVLGASLKFDGVFTLQIKSDAAVRLLVADVTTNGDVRAYAQFDASRLMDERAVLVGEGYLAFTVDQPAKDDRYQGIVKLEGDNLAEAVQHYFRQSEQIPTGIVAAARQNGEGQWRGGALMLQRMPREGGNTNVSDTSEEDAWLHAMTLMQTCTPGELTDERLASEDLLLRLFHEDGVRVFEPKTFQHRCRCSHERVVAMLEGLPRSEVKDLAVNGIVSVTCEFCNRKFEFNEASILGRQDP